jgi:hypothetical protein
MNAPTKDFLRQRPILIRLAVRSRDYRRPHVWIGVRTACAAWNLLLGIVLLAGAPWLGPLALLGLIPLAGAALLVMTVRHLQHSVQS